MVFNSLAYILFFLPLVFFGYFYLVKKKLIIASKFWLVISNLFFYSWWNINYLPLIFISISINYIVAISIFNDNRLEFFLRKKLNLLFGLIFNLGLLGFFKYNNFFIVNIKNITDINFDFLNIALPLGISFYTIKQITFLIDCYEGLVKEKKFIDYMLFVTFFPAFISGPIVRYNEFTSQITSLKNKVINYKNIAAGIFILSVGLFKKSIIADTLSPWVALGFDQSQLLNFYDAWIASLSFTFQIYFDFSGYTDMAIGSALLFNIKLPNNFNSPYKAQNIIDYWKRWHITLTNFITTYIFTPILRSYQKATFHKAMIAIMAAFFISGIWHGASWMFVIWGILHGSAIVINHYFRKYCSNFYNIKLSSKYISWLITFNFINIANIFFRSRNLDDALRILQSMLGFGNVEMSVILIYKLVFILGLLAISILLKNSAQQLNFIRSNIQHKFYFSIFTFLALISIGDYSNFLYFNF